MRLLALAALEEGRVQDHGKAGLQRDARHGQQMGVGPRCPSAVIEIGHTASGGIERRQTGQALALHVGAQAHGRLALQQAL